MLDQHPRRRSWAVTLALVALLLGACQGAGSGSEPPASEEAPASVAASQPAEEPSAAASEAGSEAPADEGVVLVAESALGPILTDANGMTLYLFTNDSPVRAHAPTTARRIGRP